MKSGQAMSDGAKESLRRKTRQYYKDPERRRGFIDSIYQVKAKELAEEWKDFERWCRQNGAVALPASPVAVVQYAGERLEIFKLEAVRRLVAVRAPHALSG